MGGDCGKAMKPEELSSDKKVIVFGSDNCPYCFKVKSIFEELNTPIDYRNIDNSQVYKTEYEALAKNLKYETIPMVFIDKKFQGGCSDIKELLASGKLTELIA